MPPTTCSLTLLDGNYSVASAELSDFATPRLSLLVRQRRQGLVKKCQTVPLTIHSRERFD